MRTQSPSNADTGQQGVLVENALQPGVAWGVMTVDATGQAVEYNSEAERVLRLAGMATVSPGSALPAALDAAANEARAAGKICNRRVTLPTPGNGDLVLDVAAVPLGAAADSNGAILLFRDASTGARYEPSLRRLDRLASVGTLSASMAHEIKNALVAIKAFVDILLEKNPDADLAGIVRREIGRVDSIVSHILNFSMAAQPSFARVDLHRVLDHALRLVQHRVGHKEIVFEREFLARTAGCHGDDHQLEQAFVNILFNAVDAIESTGTLRICTDLLGEDSAAPGRDGSGKCRIRVRISDSGSGISPENMSRIFEPFFTTKSNGTGLGLAVTRRIVTEHRGTMHVESQPGKGTTFVVLLPAAEPDAG
ncbi:MAG TPA: hypothetical protein GYA07_11975 [Verrucomicrobia bacterium]|nr:hypothetical protein [Verrucomicrobiota bacterium]HOP98330.1 ATP-binding protein [Verrucomicrobiota bacterium]HPU56254.1 ATP-binding protein [Verrucomicrobiota bacterium]